MTQLEKQIRSAQRRLGFDRWLGAMTRCVTVASVLFALTVLVQRLFDLPIPLLIVGCSAGAGALVVSLVWAVLRRDNAVEAAAALDAAAGLKERLSTGHFCVGTDDPFAQAVLADAERLSSSLSARQHIRFHVPKALAASVGSIVVCTLMFLITPGLLKSTEAKESANREDSVRQTKAAVKRKMDEVRELIDTTPVLEEFRDDAKRLNAKSGGSLTRPDDVRHEAAKKIDSLADAVKKKRNDPKYDAMREMRKRLRTLKSPTSEQGPTEKLTKALQQGDFQKAKEEIKALQEQLATLKKEKDKQAVKKLSKQLDALAKQLEKVADDEKLAEKIAEKLANAGIKKEDVDRVLESLKKKDIDQIKKMLEEQGLTKETASKLAKQIKQNDLANSMSKKLAKAMQKSAQGSSSGEQSGGAAGLSETGDQLGELEQLQQEMTQLETTMAALDQAQEGVKNGEGKGNQGKGKGKGNGRGMGKKGKGRGGLAPEESTDVSFKTERGKVKTTKGAIIGQFLIDGEQVKGEVDTSFVELMGSGEREASDRISRDRIPRQYQKSIKSYFSNVHESLDKMKRQSENRADDASAKPDTTPAPQPD